jgi:hypothetical protein
VLLVTVNMPKRSIPMTLLVIAAFVTVTGLGKLGD